MPGREDAPAEGAEVRVAQRPASFGEERRDYFKERNTMGGARRALYSAAVVSEQNPGHGEWPAPQLLKCVSPRTRLGGDLKTHGFIHRMGPCAAS